VSAGPRLAAALAAVATGAFACGSRTKTPAEPAVVVPERPATAGDPLLALAPAGADAILELDLGRLRANPVVGEVVSAFTAGGAGGAGTLDLLGAAEVLVVANYGIGGQPEQLVLVSGPSATRIAGATEAGDQIVALGSEAMTARLAAVRAGEARSLADDDELLRIRTLAMPERAPGAAVRATARLDFDDRVAVARRLDVEEVPVAVSLWGDVVDDLVVVGLVDGGESAAGQRVARSLGDIRDRLAADPRVRLMGLAPVIRGASIEARGAAAQIIVEIGPRRLERLVGRLARRLAPAEKETP
jgi:hypothetical protein